MPLSRSKRLLFIGLTIVGTYLIVEAISYTAIYCVYRGQSDDPAIEKVVPLPDVTGKGLYYADEVVHPYLGWVRRPPASPEMAVPGHPVNDFGFADDDIPIQVRSPDKIIIGILGGSVAEFASDTLEDELRNSGICGGKEPVFVRLALAGYKQPQQLMAVTYLLTLGGQFDILINLDGYNEVVLPAVENVPNRVFYSFPRSWQIRMSDATDLNTLRSVGRVTFLKERMQFWKGVVQTPPLCYSATVNLAWKIYQAHLTRLFYAQLETLNVEKSQNPDYRLTGPVQQFASTPVLYTRCARVWMRSSLQLHHLCVANGIRYFHFLQPNQYVPGSKIMGPQEIKEARHSAHAGKDSVEVGYPLLIREGQNLIEQGVAFTDLTMLFADHSEQTYLDACCHLNQRGNELMARKIADVLARDLRD
jgi:hypothetical protein